MADQNYKLRFDFIANNTKFNSAIGVSEGKLKRFSSQMTKTGRMLSTRLSLPLAAVGTLAIKQAANFEKLQTTLNTLTGSAEEGAKAFERLVQFSAKTPFQLGDLVQVNNTLMGFGLTANQAFNSLSMLGDIAGIVGGDLQSISIAFGQAAAEGRVMTRDLRQFINNGVPILDILATSMGVARGEIMDMASEGKITFDILNKAFQDATSEGGKFEGGMQVLSQTLNGLFSTLKDNVNIALAELGQEIADALNLQEGIPKLTQSIGSLVDGFKNLDDKTQRLIIVLGGVGGLFPLIAVFVGTTLPLFLAGVSAMASPVIILTGLIVGLTVALEKLTDIDFTKFFGPGGALGFAKFIGQRQVNELMAGGRGADVPSGFIGPLGPEQDRLPFSLVQAPGTFEIIKEKANDLNEVLRETVVTVNEITTRGFVPMVKISAKVLTELPKKLEPIITQFDYFAMQLIPQIGQAIVQGFNAIAQGENPLKRIGTILKGLVARLLAAAAAAMLLGAFLGGAGGGSRLLKNLGGIKGLFTSFSGIELARGGIISGPTTALIGEYPGARSNPEVVAPLSKLKTMIGGGATQGEFVLRGQDLVVALQRAERNRNRFK
jgi:tape measure domain-containing protein